MTHTTVKRIVLSAVSFQSAESSRPVGPVWRGRSPVSAATTPAAISPSIAASRPLMSALAASPPSSRRPRRRGGRPLIAPSNCRRGRAEPIGIEGSRAGGREGDGAPASPQPVSAPKTTRRKCPAGASRKKRPADSGEGAPARGRAQRCGRAEVAEA